MCPKDFGSGTDKIDILTLGVMKDIGYQLVANATTARARQLLKATIMMNDVLILNWQIAGTNASGEATEQVAVSAARVKFTDIASGANFCYDIKANKQC